MLMTQPNTIYDVMVCLSASELSSKLHIFYSPDVLSSLTNNFKALQGSDTQAHIENTSEFYWVKPP